MRKISVKKKVLAWMLLLSMTLTGMYTSGLENVFAEGTETTTTWLFDCSEGAFSETVQGRTGEFNGLTIDASVGKLEARTGNQDSQMNEGTAITIPVYAGAIVEVTAYKNSQLTIDDQSLTLDAKGTSYQAVTYTVPENTTSVVLTSGNQSYLKQIKVSPAAEPETPPSSEETPSETPETPEFDPTTVVSLPTTTTSWSFSKDTTNADDTSYFSGNLQGSNGTGTFNNLYIDATNGKCAYRSVENDTQINANTIFYIPVNGDCTLSVTAYYPEGLSINGAPLTSTLINSKNVFNYTYEGYATILKLEVASSQYFYSINTTYNESLTASETGKINVWDFAGKSMGNDSLYNDMLQTSDWNGIANLGTNEANGVFTAAGEVTINGLTVNYAKNDRIYANGSTNSYVQKDKNTTFEDKTTTTGMYYTNGSGGSSRRYITISNVQAGDTIIAYMQGRFSDASATEDNVFFEYQGTDGTQLDTAVLTTAATKLDFTAKYSGTYKIYVSTANGVKADFCRIMQVPALKVTGTINKGSYELGYCKLVFIDEATQEVKTAALDASGSFSVALTPGHKYKASLQRAFGFGISNGTVEVMYDDLINGKSAIALDLVTMETASVSGSISGFAADYDTTNLVMSFTPDVESKDVVTAVVNGDMTYTAQLETGVNYTASMTGVDDYTIAAGMDITVAVGSTETITNDITVAPVATYAVNGSFVGLAATEAITSITFTNEEGYQYAGTVSGTTYQAMLRDGIYSVTTDSANYTTSTHVVVEGGAVTRNLLFVTTQEIDMEYASDIYVGYTAQTNNFATITEAVTAVANMNRDAATQAVTIHIAPGTYREQVVVSTPNITMVNDSNEQVLVTWYYGIGYSYYSADESGFYNAENAFDQSTKNIASKWGVTFYVTKDATGFTAKNITFENSFNRYVTAEELADGVELSADGVSSKITVERTAETDVTSKEATERAAAMAIEADQTAFLNCEFLSSQDTLYTGQNISGIFRQCHIEGNTDYIYGYGDFLFDECELNFYGYSNTDKNYAGYITAARTDDNDAIAYLFRNCTITGNRNTTIVNPQTGATSVVNATAGYLGRPWGAGAKVTFINTTIDSYTVAEKTSLFIKSEGWTKMSSNTAEGANFAEYGSVNEDGKAVSTSKRVNAAKFVLTKDAADKLADDVANYYAGVGAWADSLMSETIDTNKNSIKNEMIYTPVATPTPGTDSTETGTNGTTGNTSSNVTGTISQSSTSSTTTTTDTTTTDVAANDTTITGTTSSTSGTGNRRDNTTNDTADNSDEEILVADNEDVESADTTDDTTDTTDDTTDLAEIGEGNVPLAAGEETNNTAGVAVGAICALLIAAAGVFFFRKKKQK